MARRAHLVDKQRMSHEIPVDRKRLLQRSHGRPRDAQMEVAPHGEHFAAVDVAVGHIHAADISHRAIDDGNLAVVTPVDACAERRKHHLEEWIRLHPRLLQAA